MTLDREKTQNKDKLLYYLRPMVKNGYISRRADGLYGLLQKGADLVAHIDPILAVGGDTGNRKRVAEVSHMAALLEWFGIPTITEIPLEGQNGFIPSAVWRTIRQGLISTTRFLGILFYGDMRLAVYHIGEGNYEWQLRAECSLHYRCYDDPRKRATGILLVCDDGLGDAVCKRIIRRTLWERKRLLEELPWKNSKPVKYSKAPIRVRADYQHVYLAEQSNVLDVLETRRNDLLAIAVQAARLRR